MIKPIAKQFFKLIGFFLFSISAGIGLGYLIITYLNFDVVHRKGTVSTPIAVEAESPEQDKLPILEETVVKNIILFIGDGMGINQIMATRYRYYGPNGRLNMEKMPVTGLVYTFAANGALVTDSGAGGTALATGFKTDIGMVGMTPDGKERKSILQALQERKYRTGLVTTSDITDATPGAFASSVPSRKMKMTIAGQLIENKVNLLVSGGETFHGKEMEGEEKVSLIDFAMDQGYQVVNKENEFYETKDDYILALFEGMASDKLGDEIVFNDEAPTLAESTDKAIKLLHNQAKQNNTGFFLMVEEEGVDSGSHINRIDFVTSHLKNLDDAVKVGLDFAQKDRETLVVVLADHETGGLTLVEDNATEKKLGVRWSTDKHTGQPIPLFAYGPSAVAFTGVWDNTEFPGIIAKVMGIDNFPAEEK